MTKLNPMQRWFEAQWEQRDDVVYEGLFGTEGRRGVRSTPAYFRRFKGEPQHPGWLYHGVISVPPQRGRAHWLHATSGLSNPWNLEAPGRDPSGHSGLGFELCMATSDEAPWAVAMLHHLMAWQLLVATGSVKGSPMDRGQRIPLGGPVNGDAACRLTWALCEEPPFAPSFELAAGKVDWLLLVGVTDAEVEFCRAIDREYETLDGKGSAGQGRLVRMLGEQGIWPVTDPRRDSIAGLDPAKA